MSGPRRKPWHYAAAAIVLFRAAGVAAPFLSADRFGNRLRLGLEKSLNRPVRIGEAHLTNADGAVQRYFKAEAKAVAESVGTEKWRRDAGRQKQDDGRGCVVPRFATRPAHRCAVRSKRS